jgi:hypothetical protein
MSLGPFEPFAGDLAPGDLGVLDADWSDFSLEHIHSAADPSFEGAYDRLRGEFGDRGEMERREVIEERLAWDPSRPAAGHRFLYEMVVIRREGVLVAVRDHTVILPPDEGPVVVHLSHALVEPILRGRRLAAWLRALPLTTAHKARTALHKRDSLRIRNRGVAGRSFEAGGICGEVAPVSVFLVAEMEAGSAGLPSYGRAGFRVVDPRVTPYCQPDFRHPEEIDRSAMAPVPLVLVLRRVGLEGEASLKGAELREVVSALHAMFGAHVRADHMAPLGAALEGFPSAEEVVALLDPAFFARP